MADQSEESMLLNSKTLRLADGSIVKIRPIQPGDGVRIQALVSRLSPDSRYFRFLEYIKEISPKEADRLAIVDSHSQMAYAALQSTHEGEEIIGISRYAIFDTSRPDHAEVGVVVEDRFQKQGVGTELINLLISHARREGIRKLTGTIHPTNDVILSILVNSHYPVERRFNSGLWDVEIDIQ